MPGEIVLVVDDRIDNLRFLREYVLEPSGYEMLEAANGLDGLQIALSQPVDLIISDIMMPKMGGLELLDTLQQKGTDIPTILMTFHGSEETAVKAFRLGARDYIIKPFAIEEMIAAIERALTVSRLRRERDQLTHSLLSVNQQLETRIQEMRFLYAIGRSVTSLQNLPKILNRIVEGAVYLSTAESGSLVLVNPIDQQLYLRSYCRPGVKKAEHANQKIVDNIAQQVVRTGRPVMLGGSNPEDSFQVATGNFVRALLDVPLKVGERVIGVLAVNHKSQAIPFNESHLRLLTALADYASIAIENANLYARLSSEVNEAEASTRELRDEVVARKAELAEVNLQLHKTEKLAALGYMAGGIAKALAGPINMILSDLRKLSTEVAPQNHQLVSSLAKEAFHGQKIIQNLLDFSGQRQYSPQRVNFNNLIREAWHTFSKEYKPSQITYIEDLAPDIRMVWVDASQMRQVMLYLIKYAERSMPRGGQLQFSSRNEPNELVIAIRDTGSGLSSRDLQHIFDPFYETENQAYGLELSIAHGIVTRHGGIIEADSKPGQGTIFTIRLKTEEDGG